MAVPQNKTSKARELKRRSHHALRDVTRTRCSQCGAHRLPHSICENCGHYRGKTLLKIEEF